MVTYKLWVVPIYCATKHSEGFDGARIYLIPLHYVK